MISKGDIEKLFAAELSEIKNAELRNKVVDIWVEAAKQGNWNSVEEMQSMPFTLLTNCRGVNFIQHTKAVTNGAVALVKAQIAAYDEMPYKVDMDRLIAGGLLHDIGKLIESEKDGSGGFRKSRNGKCARHPISGAILAAKAGLSDELVNTIACHAKEGEGAPQVLETVLIHQADFAAFNPLVMLAAGTLIQ